jgi:hypothetical protein
MTYPGFGGKLINLFRHLVPEIFCWFNYIQHSGIGFWRVFPVFIFSNSQTCWSILLNFWKFAKSAEVNEKTDWKKGVENYGKKKVLQNQPILILWQKKIIYGLLPSFFFLFMPNTVRYIQRKDIK